MHVRVRTPVHSSEDPTKVRKALLALFPNARVTEREDGMEAESDALDHFRTLIRKQKILDASRRALLGSLNPEGTRSVFRLSKQAAWAGRVSFALEGSPLGDLVVHVEGERLEAAFKEMAPMTIHGNPVSEEQAQRHLEKRRKRKQSEATVRSAEWDLGAEEFLDEPEEPA